MAVWDLAHGGERSRTLDVSSLRPGRRARVFPSVDGHLLVVDGDAIGSAAHVYDFATGQRRHAFGDRVPTQGRVFLTGNVFCRQKTLVDVRTGLELPRSLEVTPLLMTDSLLTVDETRTHTHNRLTALCPSVLLLQCFNAVGWTAGRASGM